MLQKIYSTLFPPTCILCDADSFTNSDICSACFSTLPHNHICCSQCATPLPHCVNRDSALKCGGCLVNKSKIDTSIAPFRYEAPADYIVHQLKFQGSLKFGRLIGELVANAVKSTPRPDLLLPVPLHHQRLLERGFNHAAMIAKITGKCLSIPVCEDLAIKLDARPPQAGLDAIARRKNMRNAFHIERRTEKQHIAIVDDVVTTGATTESLAGALIKAGCSQVSVWAFARTVQ